MNRKPNKTQKLTPKKNSTPRKTQKKEKERRGEADFRSKKREATCMKGKATNII